MATKSKIQDQTFLFTGTLTEFTREEAEALVEANGGNILSGVSAKLNYLVVGADAGSKLDKAKALGSVKILTEKEFLKMVPKTAANKPSAKNSTTTKKTAAKKVVSSKKTETIKSAKTATKVEVNEKNKESKEEASSHLIFSGPVVRLSPELEAIVGKGPMPRTEVTMKVWDYIKKNNLQDRDNLRIIKADTKLLKVFGGNKNVNMLEISELVNKHLS
jgi:upstream activation factor subunit UAF30